MQCHSAVMRDRWHEDTIIVSIDAEAMDQSLPDTTSQPVSSRNLHAYNGPRSWHRNRD